MKTSDQFRKHSLRQLRLVVTVTVFQSSIVKLPTNVVSALHVK